MTRWLSLGLLAVSAGLWAQEGSTLYIRYKIEFNPINYPQKTPQDAMKSITKAFDTGRYDYMMAQLADPKWVDARVAEYHDILFPKADLQREEEEIAREPDLKTRKIKAAEKQKKDKARLVVAFNRLVAETRRHLDDDPVLTKELRLFARDAEWEVDDEKAVATMKKITPRRVILRKREDRWFMDERYQ